MSDVEKIIAEQTVEDETTDIPWGLIVFGIILLLLLFFGFNWLNRKVSAPESTTTLFGRSDFSYKPGSALMNA